MAGITFGNWVKLLARNRFAISPAYFHRAVFITLASLSNSGLAALESARFGKKIKQTKIIREYVRVPRLQLLLCSKSVRPPLPVDLLNVQRIKHL